MALYIVKPWYKKEAPPEPALIYGAEWAGGSNPAWTRTDAAASFADPNPYYAGMSGTPSSPFDNIMPWSGMHRVTDASAGELVEIPKFYYKWTREGSKMKLQISMKQFDGSHVSPAHADRGDGVGERDYVYVGRYHCSSSNYKSASGVKPRVNATRSSFRSGIHNLGAYIWQWDYALYWTIGMLMLVEYANWNLQAAIGYGCGNGSGVENSGASDNMPYHTGTTKTSRSTYGVGVQYRHIEDIWANALDWVDGIYFSGNNAYCIKNPVSFSDSTGGTLVGAKSSNTGCISSWVNPSVSGFEYALLPNGINGTDYTKYCCDFNAHANYGQVLRVGGTYLTGLEWGYFVNSSQVEASYYDSGIGTHLMVLPPSRII